MTDQEIKIREMEERIKKLEDKVFNQWLSQYDDIVEFEQYYHYNDMPTVGPLHCCSQEEIDENNKKWKEYLANHKF